MIHIIIIISFPRLDTSQTAGNKGRDLGYNLVIQISVVDIAVLPLLS